MTNHNKRKGSAFEAECVDFLRAHGYPQAARTLAGARDDRGDIGNVPFTMQCKNQKEYRLAEWIDQTEQQAKNASQTRFVVVFKRPRVTDPAQWYSLMPLWLAAELLREDV